MAAARRGGRAGACARFPERSIQPVDVRDLAVFAIHVAEAQVGGAYNVAAPIGGETFGELLGACADVTGSEVEFVWVADGELLAHGVRQWSEIPLWRTFPGVWQVDAAAAQGAGLSCMPLATTVADTWAWMRDADAATQDERAAEIGISRDREKLILASVA